MKFALFSIVLVSFVSCQVKKLPTYHNFPSPVDTADKPILLQEKKTYQIDGIQLSNESVSYTHLTLPTKA